MERNMQLSEDVIRHMTLRVDELEEEPSAVMKFRGERTRSYSDRSDSKSSGSTSEDEPKVRAEESDAPKAANTATEVTTEPAADPLPETEAVPTDGASG
jgi:small subunit ribosomal protein S6